MWVIDYAGYAIAFASNFSDQVRQSRTDRSICACRCVALSHICPSFPLPKNGQSNIGDQVRTLMRRLCWELDLG